MHLWVVGAGGLFGSAFMRWVTSNEDQVFTGSRIPWSDAQAALHALTSDARNFLAQVRSHGEPWGIVWAAGRVTTSSTDEQAAEELELFRSFVQMVARELAQQAPTVPGNFLLASSAGGIYAGSTHPPFDSRTDPQPISAYGRLKLDQEQSALDFLSDHLNVRIARMANLYGPGQDLGKLQGLISRLALSAIVREPLTMFVPLDTLRDYIYVDDAAALARHWLSQNQADHPVTVIASGEAASLGQIIGLVQDIAHVRIPIAYGLHPSTSSQARDMRLLPDSDDWTTHLPRMPLPAGIKITYEDILKRCQQATVPTSVR